MTSEADLVEELAAARRRVATVLAALEAHREDGRPQWADYLIARLGEACVPGRVIWRDGPRVVVGTGPSSCTICAERGEGVLICGLRHGPHVVAALRALLALEEARAAGEDL